MAISRVCIAISKENKKYIDSQVKKNKETLKSRSYAINALIDERRQDGQFNNR